MTHFRTVVIVPKKIWTKGEKAVNNFIAEEMAPYCEVGAGCDPDYCEFEITHRKRNFKKDAEQILAQLKDDKELTKKYKELIKEKKYEDLFQSWEGGELDSDGNFGYFTNHDSFYDYYRIGGRWDGVITGKPKESDGGFNWGNEHEELENNSVPVKALYNAYKVRANELGKIFEAREYIAKIFEDGDMGYAKPFRKFFGEANDTKWKELYDEIGKELAKQIRTLDYGPFYNQFMINKIVAEGKVYEYDDVGWWGMSSPLKSRDEWAKEYEALLEAHLDDIAVALDCHV